MPLRSCLGLVVALIVALHAALPAPWVHASNCDSTSKGFVPLTDLGAGSYQGFLGGLYPGGVNVPPAAHLAAGVAIANAIAPDRHRR